MDVVTANNGIDYKIEMPQHDLNANTVWVSPATRKTLSASEEQRINDIVNRKSGALAGSLLRLSGRSLAISGPELSRRAGQPFDTIEISGYGVQNFIQEDQASGIAIVNLGQEIKIPHIVNFYDDHPGVANHGEILYGDRVRISDPYSFSGAYPLEKAAEKVAIAKEAERVAKDAGYPVLVPVPLLVGRYDSIKHKDYGNAYYTVSAVPYEGQRTGNAIGQAEMRNMIPHAYASMFAAGEALSFMHNVMQVSHNSFTLGNTGYRDENKPILISDWATAKRLDPRDRDNHLHRANDLSRYFESFMNTCKAYDKGNTDYKSLIGLSLQELLYGYLGATIDVRQFLDDSTVEALKTSAAYLYFADLLKNINRSRYDTSEESKVSPMNFVNVNTTVKKILKAAN